MMKEKINEYYKKGFWTLEMVRNAVLKGKITQEEFEEIVSEAEVEDERVH